MSLNIKQLFAAVVGLTSAAFAPAYADPVSEATHARITTFVAGEEGFRSTAYDDLRPNMTLVPGMQPKGTLTLGYGFTGPNIKIGDTITKAEATEQLGQKISGYITQVQHLIGDDASEADLTAFVDFAFNLGVETLAKSTALARYKAGDRKGAAEAMTWYTKAAGQHLPGLASRRQRESQLILHEEVDSFAFAG